MLHYVKCTLYHPLWYNEHFKHFRNNFIWPLVLSLFKNITDYFFLSLRPILPSLQLSCSPHPKVQNPNSHPLPPVPSAPAAPWAPPCSPLSCPVKMRRRLASSSRSRVLRCPASTRSVSLSVSIAIQRISLSKIHLKYALLLFANLL